MHSTLKPRDSDPHDDFTIAPDVVPAAWADKVLADITRDATSHPDAGSAASDRQPAAASGGAAAAPTVDTTFRATATDDIRVAVEQPSTRRWGRSAVMVVMFALCSALAAAAWQHYGDAARQMLAKWTPPFGLTSSPPEKTGLAEQADTPAVQPTVAGQATPQGASSTELPAGVAAAATIPPPDAAQLQLMARDFAAMAQQVEQLKVSIAELRVSQQAMARDVAKTSESRPAEIKPSVPNPRPRISAAPLRSAAAPPHRPLSAYPSAQTAVPAPLPQAAPPPASTLPAPPSPQATAQPQDEPIVRPPMPLR